MKLWVVFLSKYRYDDPTPQQHPSADRVYCSAGAHSCDLTYISVADCFNEMGEWVSVSVYVERCGRCSQAAASNTMDLHDRPKNGTARVVIQIKTDETRCNFQGWLRGG